MDPREIAVIMVDRLQTIFPVMLKGLYCKIMEMFLVSSSTDTSGQKGVFQIKCMLFFCTYLT